MERRKIVVCDELFKDLYKTKTNLEVAQILGSTVYRVRKHAKNLEILNNSCRNRSKVKCI